MYSGFNDAAELRENNFKPHHKGSFKFLYGSGSEDSCRRHIGIREDPGDEVEHFSESEQGLGRFPFTKKTRKFRW